MKTWIGAAIVAAALAFGGPAAMGSPAQAVKTTSQATSLYQATDFSARRYHRYYRHYGYRYYRPHYYARPYYYRPTITRPSHIITRQRRSYRSVSASALGRGGKQRPSHVAVPAFAGATTI